MHEHRGPQVAALHTLEALLVTTTFAAPMSSVGPRADRVGHAAAVVAATVLASAGLVLVALALAFPLAVAVVQQQSLPVAPADLAIAERLSAAWYVFAAAAAANFTAALAVLDRGTLGRRIGIAVAGVSFGLAIAAQVGAVINGLEVAAGGVAVGATTAYGVALVASIIARR
jgi:hypothetical protein